jgi:hypothetical protein
MSKKTAFVYDQQVDLGSAAPLAAATEPPAHPLRRWLGLRPARVAIPEPIGVLPVVHLLAVAHPAGNAATPPNIWRRTSSSSSCRRSS